MLSVLVPVYNEDIRSLASDLHKQMESLSVEVELIFGDDASDNLELVEQNQEYIKNLKGISYHRHAKNLKYCANRNELALIAKQDYLLFLDADVRINRENFLEDWLAVIPSDNVYCGGNVYQRLRPLDKKLILKWIHGKEREEANHIDRNLNPYLKFSSSNFLIKRELFLKNNFDGESSHYGYNDTVYAYTLRNKGIAVKHIDNSVLNHGLMTDDLFLKKAREAIDNLVFFESRPYIQEDFKEYIKVLRVYYQLKKWKVAELMRVLLKPFQNTLERGLYSREPNLRNLDLLKLYYLLEAKRS